MNSSSGERKNLLFAVMLTWSITSLLDIGLETDSFDCLKGAEDARVFLFFFTFLSQKFWHLWIKQIKCFSWFTWHQRICFPSLSSSSSTMNSAQRKNKNIKQSNSASSASEVKIFPVSNQILWCFCCHLWFSNCETMRAKRREMGISQF